MFATVNLCLSMLVFLSLFIYLVHVYLFTPVYLCLPMFTRVSCLSYLLV